MGTLEHLGRLEDYGVKPETGDISDLFDDGSKEKEVQDPAAPLSESEIKEMIGLIDGTPQKERKELTPEAVLEIWEGLSSPERKLATTSDEQFDALIDQYGKARGIKKQNIVAGLRKLIQSGSELASLIET
jgi:hypothetical protein